MDTTASPLASPGAESSPALTPTSPPFSPTSSTLSIPTKPSIKVTQIKDRSTGSFALSKLVRPLRSRLLKIKEQPAGSIQLNAPEFCHEHCTVHERVVKDIYIYDINVRHASTDKFVHYLDAAKTFRRDSEAPTGRSSPIPRASHPNLKVNGNGNGTPKTPTNARKPSPLSHTIDEPETSPKAPLSRFATAPHHASADFYPLTQTLTNTNTAIIDWALFHDGQRRKRPRHIYYFAGGSWQMPPSKEHWKLCTELTRQLTARGTQTTVSLVSHPLAPNTPATSAFPVLEELYYELFPSTSTKEEDQHHLSDHNPEIIFAGDSSGGNVALALTLHVLASDLGAPAPASLMLISPTVDMRTDNPALAALEKKDAIHTLKSVQQAHNAWRGSMSELDPRVSPILADLSKLKGRGVHINGVNAGADMLSADTKRLLKRLEEEGVQGRWLDWDKQMHCFPLTFSYGLEEGKLGVDWIVNCIDSPLSRPS